MQIFIHKKSLLLAHKKMIPLLLQSHMEYSHADKGEPSFSLAQISLGV